MLILHHGAFPTCEWLAHMRVYRQRQLVQRWRARLRRDYGVFWICIWVPPLPRALALAPAEEPLHSTLLVANQRFHLIARPLGRYLLGGSASEV